MPKGRYQPGYKKKWKKGDRNYNDPKYNVWRKAVRARDGNQCMKCGKIPSSPSTQLVCHHIKRWADIPTLRFAVGNGITLCRPCHKFVTGNEDAFAPLLLSLLLRKQRANAKNKKTDIED